MSDPAAPPALRCTASPCPTPPTWYIVGRCIECRAEMRQWVCDEHRGDLTTAMFLFNVLSECHRKPVTLARIEPLP